MIYKLIGILKNDVKKLKITNFLKVVICEGIYVQIFKTIICFDKDGVYITQ